VRSFVPSLVKLGIFALVTVLLTGVLAATIANTDFGETSGYLAKFTDASGLKEGDDVRIAGVKVGQVDGIEVVEGERNLAQVRFDVEHAYRLPETVTATIKYRNLVGQRYLALTDEIGSGAALSPGSTIPVGQTTPALDLTVLFNGFKPLFQALSPNDINQLSYEIVQVFQGEGGSLDSLLAHTASLTSTLADRNKVIDSLISNLNEVLDHIGQRDQQLSNLIVTFKQFVHGLAQDKGAILGSLNQISDLSVQMSDLVSGVKNPLTEDIKQLKSFAGSVAGDRDQLDKELQLEPLKLQKIGATADYGSWFNFYLCAVHGNIRLPGSSKALPVNYNTGSARCNLG
jgi:phospholipid/cholesterol/gamma-HCH transport system substrate-binding protein